MTLCYRTVVESNMVELQISASNLYHPQPKLEQLQKFKSIPKTIYSRSDHHF